MEKDPEVVTLVDKVRRELAIYIDFLVMTHRAPNAYFHSAAAWKEIIRDQWYERRRNRLLRLMAVLEIDMREFVEFSRAEVPRWWNRAYGIDEDMDVTIKEFVSGADGYNGAMGY